MVTLFGGILYIQKEVQESLTLMIVIMVFIALFNLQFLLTWVLRLTTLVFRFYLVKLREMMIFKFLNYLDINDYEADLKIVVR
jgi:hypothetical protein